jgi:hypothetical protein
MGQFKINSGAGFYITFDNDFRISVQFGIHNYCDNKKLIEEENITLLPTLYQDEQSGKIKRESGNAEIAVINPKGDLIEWDHGDTVSGYMTPNEFAYLTLYVSRFGSNWDGLISIEEGMLNGI